MRTFYALFFMEFALWLEGFLEKLTGIDYELPSRGFIWGMLIILGLFAMILQDYMEITRKETRIEFNNVNKKNDV